jgi:hypothetical protein
MIPTYGTFLILCAVIAFLSGLGKELRDHREEDISDNLAHMLASTVSCGIAGFVVAVCGLYFFPGYELLLLAASAVTGWNGPGVLDVLGAKLNAFISSKTGGDHDRPN